MPKKHDVTHDHGSGGSPLSQPAHSLTYEAVIKELGTELDEGLSPGEATRRLDQYGPNKLDEGEGVSVVKILVRQVANAMMLVRGPLPILSVNINRSKHFDV
jgi:magnesium-transporting ATPase (P-type)